MLLCVSRGVTVATPNSFNGGRNRFLSPPASVVWPEMNVHTGLHVLCRYLNKVLISSSLDN